MKLSIVFLFLLISGIKSLFAQEVKEEVVWINPVLGDTIVKEEMSRYRLFPFFKTDEFKFAPITFGVDSLYYLNAIKYRL